MTHINELLTEWNQNNYDTPPCNLYKKTLYFLLDITHTKRGLFLIREKSHFKCVSGFEQNHPLSRQALLHLNQSLKIKGLTIKGHEISQITHSKQHQEWILITLGRSGKENYGVICLQNPEEDLSNPEIQNTIELLKAFLYNQLRFICNQKTLEKLQKENINLRKDIVKINERAIKSEIAFKFTHEFNNLISSARAHIDLCLIKLKPKKYDEFKSRLEKVIGVLDNMTRLTDSLQQRRIGDPVCKSIPPADFVEHLKYFITPLSKHSHVQINYDYTDHLSNLYIDIDLMGQVLYNLVKNSIEAKPDVTITIHISEYSDFSLIRFNDNGPGLGFDTLDPFIKKHYSTKKNGHGYGILICKEIIESHGGQFSLHSTGNEGTLFDIVLPFINCRFKESGSTHSEKKKKDHSKTQMIIDEHNFSR